METYTYTKTITDQIKFLHEIKQSSLDETKISYIEDIGGGDVKITTYEVLSSGDETTLENLVTAHPDSNIASPDDEITSSSPRVDVAFGGDKKPYVRRKGSTYGVLAYVIFEGTTVNGTPSKIKVSTLTEKTNKSYDLRISNADTGDIIAEKTGLSNTAYTIVDLGDLSNLPSTETIFEIQSKSSDNTTHVRLSNLLIQF
jgi:hypothetical protein